MRINHFGTTSRRLETVPVASAFLYSVSHEKNPRRSKFRSSHIRFSGFDTRLFLFTPEKPVSHRLPAGVKPNKRPSHLFQGFSTVARLEQASQNLDQYQLQRNAVREKISLRVRAQMENVKAAHFAIQQSQLAEVAARKGLEIVTDGYSRGGVSILSLLDAQNSSLRTDLVAANALYDFFVAYMQLQRSIGKFDILMTPEARLQMLDRVLQSMKAALKK